METIPQRTLRNQSSEVLRRAEAGERFVITVHGRPVAELGPASGRQWVSAATVRELLKTPTDPDWEHDLRRQGVDELIDPWVR
jgi:prevent-host-death family protein